MAQQAKITNQPRLVFSLQKSDDATKKQTIWSKTYSSILSHSPQACAHKHTAVVLPETPYVFPRTDSGRGRRGLFFGFFFHGKPFKRASVSVCGLQPLTTRVKHAPATETHSEQPSGGAADAQQSCKFTTVCPLKLFWNALFPASPPSAIRLFSFACGRRSKYVLHSCPHPPPFPPFLSVLACHAWWKPEGDFLFFFLFFFVFLNHNSRPSSHSKLLLHCDAHQRTGHSPSPYTAASVQELMSLLPHCEPIRLHRGCSPLKA